MLGLPTVDDVSLFIASFVDFHSIIFSKFVFSQGKFFHEF